MCVTEISLGMMGGCMYKGCGRDKGRMCVRESRVCIGRVGCVRDKVCV